MIFLIALQIMGATVIEQPLDATLRFAFQRDAAVEARIKGSSSKPTPWSLPAVYRILTRCGAGRVSVLRRGGTVIQASAPSGQRDVAIARCVRRSTSLYFSVGTRERGRGARPFNDELFRDLWNR